MIDPETLEAELITYLSGKFSDVKITQIARLFSDKGTAFRIVADNEEYQLRILDEVLVHENITDLVTFLEGSSTDQVMRSLIGFPVTITHNGCVFDDI